MFKKAEKRQAKLRLALAGVSGAGKTYSALVLAKALGGKVALIDSERGSAALYADRFDFDSTDLTDHGIDKYRQAIAAAATAGYGVLIVDSLSHEWAGRGGALEEVDRKKDSNMNSFTAWNGVTQRHQGLLDDLLRFPGHVIVTMRKKNEYVLEEQVKNGRKIQVPKKVGMAVVQRDGIEYEFTVMIGLELGGIALVEKSRCSALQDMSETLRRDDLPAVGAMLKQWLESGAPALVAAPVQSPVPSPPVPQSIEALKAQMGGALVAGALEWPPNYFGKTLAQLASNQLEWCIAEAKKRAELGGDDRELFAVRLMEFTDEYARRAAAEAAPKVAPSPPVEAKKRRALITDVTPVAAAESAVTP